MFSFEMPQIIDERRDEARQLCVSLGLGGFTVVIDEYFPAGQEFAIRRLYYYHLYRNETDRPFDFLEVPKADALVAAGYLDIDACNVRDAGVSRSPAVEDMQGARIVSSIASIVGRYLRASAGVDRLLTASSE